MKICLKKMSATKIDYNNSQQHEINYGWWGTEGAARSSQGRVEPRTRCLTGVLNYAELQREGSSLDVAFFSSTPQSSLTALDGHPHRKLQLLSSNLPRFLQTINCKFLNFLCFVIIKILIKCNCYCCLVSLIYRNKFIETEIYNYVV